MNIFVQCVVMFVCLILVPLIVGHYLCHSCKLRESLALNYIVGMFFEWTVFQIIAVPAIEEKKTLTFVSIIWCCVMFIITFWGILNFFIIKKDKPKIKPLYKYKELVAHKIDWILMIIMILLVGYQMYLYVVYQHTDKDDARFVANSVIAWETDTMFLVNPANGEMMGQPVGELVKDVVSPWMMYIAMLAKLSQIHPAIIAHTILPVFLLAMAYGAYWLIAEVLFPKKRENQYLFVILISIFNLFGCTSAYTSATFFLTRIWQGKSIVAGVVIPFLIAVMLMIREQKKGEHWILLIFLLNCGACLLSGMGIIFSALMVGCYLFVYAIEEKSLCILLSGVIVCVPNIIYGLLYAF